MITYQDLLLVADDDTKKMDFVRKCIREHQANDDTAIAETAELYYRHKNKTINEFKKWIYLVTGKKVEDTISANYKIGSNIFRRLVDTEVHFSLGNGATFDKEETKAKLGNDFDDKLKDGGTWALVQKVSFGFWNLDHIEIFKLSEFKPLWDEENGSLCAGVRFWQLADDRPLRATLYELDGYTDYIWRTRNKDGRPVKNAKGEILHAKRPYKQKVVSTLADGETILEGENYPMFPIVPFWGNKLHQSEFVGFQEAFDCVDLIKSGYANNVDEASFIFWTIKNAPGMDDKDLTDFIDHLKTIHAATTEGDAIPTTVDAPYESREKLLERLERDIYKDWMAVSTEYITAGNDTATAIKAAFEPQNIKADEFEYCVIDFVGKILELAGIDDKVTFTRSQLTNRTEEINTLLSAGQVLHPEYLIKKILTLYGDGDLAEDMIQKMMSDELAQAGAGGNEEEDET